MRLVLSALLITTTAATAFAQRLDTTQMTCNQARSVVARDGAQVLASGPLLYDRYVSSARFCSYGEIAQPAFAPTRDTPTCPVGNLCKTPERDRVDREMRIFP